LAEGEEANSSPNYLVFNGKEKLSYDRVVSIAKINKKISFRNVGKSLSIDPERSGAVDPEYIEGYNETNAASEVS
jgi:hypothetical protein